MAINDRTNERTILTTGGGEPLPDAFEKINQNFDELFQVALNVTDIAQNLIPSQTDTYNLGGPLRRFKELYLSGNSIHLGGVIISVDEQSNELTFGGVKVPTQTDLDAAIGATQSGPLTGTLTGDVYANDSTLLVDSVNGKITGPVEANVTGNVTGNLTGNVTGNVTGELVGSVFSDDSVVLVDGVNGKLVGPIQVNEFNYKTLLDITDIGNVVTVSSLNADLTLLSADDLNVTATDNLTLTGADVLIVGKESATSSGSDIRITGGTSTDTENFGFGGSVVIQAGENPNAIQQDGGINIGTDHTNGVTIGAYDFGNGFGTIVNISGVRNYIGESSNRSTTYLRGTIDFSDATVSELNVDLTGNFEGSVFADDSTLLVDGVNGKIVGPVENNFAYINTIVPVPGSLGNISIAADPGELAGGGINIVAGRGLGDANGGQITIDAGTITDNGTRGNVNLGTSSSQTGAVYIGYPIASHIVVSNDLNRITLNGDVDFTNATVTGLTLDGDVTGSVFGDDSTLLVDGVNSKINLQNTVLNNTISTTDEVLYLNTASTPGERGFKVSTTDSIFDIYGATLEDGNGGGLWLSGGIAEPGMQGGDVIISGRIVSILAGDGEGGGGIALSPIIGRIDGDIQGSVFADDSTTLVDGVNGTISADNLTGTIPTNVEGRNIITHWGHLDGTTIDSGSGNFTVSLLGSDLQIFFNDPMSDAFYAVNALIDGGIDESFCQVVSKTITYFQLRFYEMQFVGPNGGVPFQSRSASSYEVSFSVIGT